MALNDERIGDTIVWMMDDLYFVDRVTIEELRVPRKASTFTPARLANFKATNGFQSAKQRTIEALFEKGYPAHDFHDSRLSCR
ncbi:MAG: hypothetical protein R3C03_24175 [Pirellulaceae bacterium]